MTTVRKKIKQVVNLFLLSSLISCGSNNSTDKVETGLREIVNFAPYKIHNTVLLETSSYSKVVSYAYLTTGKYAKPELTATLKKIYAEALNNNKFTTVSSPTAIGVYLFTSEDMAKNSPQSWIAMLATYPTKNQPYITFNDMKINSLNDAQDTLETADDRMLKMLTKYLKERGTDICSIYKKLSEMEMANGRRADAKYPNFGLDHLEYSEKLDEQTRKKIFHKYNISDTLSTYIAVFGMNYCK